MRCKKCGEELPERARFCFVCGEPVDDVPEPRRLEEPLDPMAAGAVPMVPVAPPPRAVRVDARPVRVTPRPVHPGTASGAAERRLRATAEKDAPSRPERESAPEEPTERTREFAAECEAAREGHARSGRGRRSARRHGSASRRVPWVVPVVGALVVIVVIVAVVGISTSWIGPFAAPSEEVPQVQPPSDGSIAPISDGEEQPAAEQEQPAAEGEPAVRDAVDDYSWDELSQISALIAAADSDEEGLRIAERYNLCDAGGELDGTQTKDLELADGSTVPCAVAGFRQDERADGEGVAGITFVSLGSVGAHAYGTDGPVTWEDSELRSWMNSSLLNELPSELADAVVPVTKRTNDLAGSGGSALETEDSLWAPSYAEICGGGLNSTMPAEGEQYELFSQLGVNGSPSSELALCDDYWWLRSPSSQAQWQATVTPEGDPHYARNPLYEFDVVAGFCL